MPQEERNWKLYKYTNKINELVYIGITSRSLEERWQNGHGYRNNQHLDRAIKKYGQEAFDRQILISNLTFEEAAQKEIETIAEYDATNPQKGYNIALGGTAPMWNRHHTEENKKKFSEQRKGANNAFYGKHHDLATLPTCIPVICLNNLQKFLSISDAARKMTEQGYSHCSEKGISAVMCEKQLTAGKDNKENPLFWEKYDSSKSEEFYNDLYRQRLQEYADYSEEKLYNKTGKSRKKKVVDIKTGEIYPGAREVAEIFNTTRGVINGVCRGEKNMIYDKIFLYLEDCEKMSPEDVKEEILKRWMTKNPKGEIVYPLVCLNTGEIFPNAVEAKKITDLLYTDAISLCAKGKCEYGGTSKDKQFLKWAYYDKYAEMSPEEIKRIVNAPVKGHQPVLCITTGQKFRDAQSAADYFGLFRTGIQKCCQGKYRTCGEDKNGNRMQWQYLDKYDYPNHVYISKQEQENVENEEI